ncbi:NAD(P)-binding domain [Penicillium camemberti]|uniref:NAD(P)-binding domain n=1 Tax=Penicillium camemberti (strain FM 013) TaxID=1429867 RepID=A0A0G4P5Q4_PENC3|nr:NAD(P)-binding domain [Penicillium camemberti]
MAVGYAKDQPEGFTNRIENVAIVGAGGSVGRHLIDQLLKNGKHIVTAITRPSSTNQMPEGVQIALVDYASDDDTALVEILRGQQVLLITMNVMAPPDTMIKLIRAAAKAGVPYIEPNWYGHDAANNSLCDDSLLTPNRDRVIAEITRLGVSTYLFLVCNFWYEFSLGGGPDRFGFDFLKRSLTLYDGGDVPINTSTWPQTGRAIAKLLSLKELPEDENDQSPTLSQFRNRSLYVSSFRLTQREMFESVKRVTKTSDADWTITQDSVARRFKEGQEGMKVHNWNVFTKMLYSRMFFANGDGDYESRRGLDNQLLDLPIEDLDEATAEGIRMAENNEVPFSH